MKLQITSRMFEYYLDDITVGWFDHHDLPPDKIEHYHDCVMEMKLRATNKKELEFLKNVLEYILIHPEIDCEEFAGGRYPYDSEEVREIIEFAYRTIWPDSWPIDAEKVPEIEFI